MTSNRLPVRVEIEPDGFRTQLSSGGLVSAVGALQDAVEFAWVGWPGCEVPASLQPDVAVRLADDRLVPVFLSREEEQGYYHEYSNQVLWPLLHYFTDRLTPEPAAWDTYRNVNQRFADVILQRLRPGDRVWVHDLHLMLVPALLRAAVPDLEIGFFLHTPWPSSEIFRMLPQREALLRGLLGADFVAFHTNDYAMHFRATCLRVLGLESDPDGVAYAGRRVAIGRHPIGIDTDHFRTVARRPRTREVRAELEARYAGKRLLLGVERLDYTKGIRLKLLAFERLLQQDPALAETVTLLQLVVPSRLGSSEYRDLKDAIEADVGRINGRYGRPGHTPVEYMHRSVDAETLVALYQIADVGMVTPIRDGMNLVAQEFVLCQEQGAGILILSEFAGAAQVLGESILVNPWDTEQTAAAIADALAMPADQRRLRMGSMLARVESMDCRVWARRFLEVMHRAAQASHRLARRAVLSEATCADLRAAFRRARRRVLLLDYDGTLQDLAPTPDLASPAPELLELLATLCAAAHTDVHIVSGRSAASMQAWLGHLPLYLCGEHGAVYREPGRDWVTQVDHGLAWKASVRKMLEQTCAEVPGSHVEEKTFALAWHYRRADPEYGAWRARELMTTLEQEVATQGFEVILGHKVIEVRAAGVNKGNYARRVLAGVPADAFVLCIGDDRTDFDMYRALPASAVSIHVGRAAAAARYTIESVARVRRLLADFAAD